MAKSKQKKRSVSIHADSDLSFDPMKLIETSISSGFDASAIGEIDERQMNWAPNVAAWIIEPEYLGIKTIYPHQLQVLLRLFGDVCPYCSDWDFYKKDFQVDIKMGDLLDRVQLLNLGKCPKCGKTKLDAYKDGYWLFPHEIDLLWGMRCQRSDALVFTDRGLVKLSSVVITDRVTHGTVSECFDSGVLESLIVTTDYNWTMVASKKSHIVPVLNEKFEFEFRMLHDCKVGDCLVMHSPNLWPESRVKVADTSRKVPHGSAKVFVAPTEVTPEVARLLGYLVSDGYYTQNKFFGIMSSDPDVEEDIVRCCISVFGESPIKKPCTNTTKCDRLELYGVEYVAWLRQLGLSPATAKSKSIPDCILQSPKEVVCEFLAGLFGGDGGIFREKNTRKVLLYYTTVSKTLMEQVRLLLLNLGILTRCSTLRSNGFRKSNTYLSYDTDTDTDTNLVYTISTKNSGFVRIFKNNVRLASRKKTEAYEWLSDSSRIVVPTPVGDFRTDSKVFPPRLTKLLEDGYHFVRIKTISDGDPVPMMDVHIPSTNIYTADGFVHHNSGKSAVAGMLGSYVLHRYLSIPDPASYFGLLKGSLLAMRFVALTAGQASETIWGQFQRSVENCNWFGQYHDFLKHYEQKYGMELQKWLNTVFSYPMKGIFGYFLGASIDKSRGRTAIFSAFDEIGWWLGQKDGKLGNADETYAAYEKASRTIRNAAMPRFHNGDYNIPTALIAAVSSTSSKDDYIMRLIRGAKQDRKKVWSHKASWEVNPDFAANPEELREERDKNFKTYQRDYGSIPPYANEPFIENEELALRNTSLERPYWPVLQETGKVGEYLDAEKIDKNNTIPYCLAMDMSYNHCGYAAALLKLKESDFSTIQVAGLFSIYPSKNQVIDLSYTFDNFVKKMCEKLPIRLVVYDQWQSKSQIQSLQHMNVKAQSYSLNYQNFDNFRTQLYQGKIEFIQPEVPLDEIDSAVILEDVLYPKPYLHFLWQLLSVSEVGNKIGKGEGHDDLFRSVVLGSTFLWNEEWRPEFEYKSGQQNFVNYKKGRLALAGGSLSSGQSYTINSGNKNMVYGTNKKPIGTIIQRTGGQR